VLRDELPVGILGQFLVEHRPKVPHRTAHRVGRIRQRNGDCSAEIGLEVLRVLEHELTTLRALQHRAHELAVVAVGGDDHDRLERIGPHERIEDLEPVLHVLVGAPRRRRELKVEEYDIGMHARRQLDRVASGRGSMHDVAYLFQRNREISGVALVVFHHEHLRLRRPCHGSSVSARGSSTKKHVSGSPKRMFSRPPMSSA
jgi:hypothetical protein